MSRSTFSLPGAWIAVLMLLPFPIAIAQSVSGGSYTVRKFAIAGGGGQLQGAPCKAAVTVGQSAAQVSNGGGYRLVSGFHPVPNEAPVSDTLFGSGFENTPCTGGRP